MLLKVKTYREDVQKFEEEFNKQPGVMHGDCYPLKHEFADGLYIRTIYVPKDQLVVTKIHKFSHPVFLMEGEVTVIEESGMRRVKAPCSFITPAGTKRVCYTNQATVWTTVHSTKETNLNKIEDEIIAKDFEEVDQVHLNNIVQLMKEGGV